MKLYTKAELAELLRVSAATIQRMIASGRLPVVRIGGSVRITQETVDRLLTPPSSKEEKVKIVNCTPHALHLITSPDGETLTIPPSGFVPRVAQQAHAVDGYEQLPVPVVRMSYGAGDPLPDEQRGHYYVVSALYAQSFSPPRRDVLVPADMVRDGEGRIIGCRSLSTLSDRGDCPAQED